jgi:hypothetical protein
VAGLRYSSVTNFDPNTRKEIGLFSQDPRTEGEFIKVIDYVRERSSEVNQWSAMLNAAYRFSPNHNVSILVMPNFTGVNSANADSGFNEIALINYDFLREFSFQQYYEERSQIIYQLNSSHFFPVPKLRLEFGIGYTDGNSNTPDFKTLKYGKTEDGYAFRQYFYPTRNYRYLDENIFESGFSAELPFFEKTGLARKIKFGASFRENILVWLMPLKRRLNFWIF